MSIFKVNKNFIKNRKKKQLKKKYLYIYVSYNEEKHFKKMNESSKLPTYKQKVFLLNSFFFF